MEAKEMEKDPTSRKKRRLVTLLTKFSLSFASLMFMLLMLELVVRLFWPQNISFLEFHEELGWIHKKNTKGYYRQENLKPAFVSINSHGLRTSEVPLQKGETTTRILFLGDSYVQGLSVDDNSTFCQRLEQQLNQRYPGRAFEVINGGVGGYGPIQEMLLLDRIIGVYGPDLIVQVFYTGNDFIDNADPAGGRRPIGKLDANGTLVVIPPKPHSMLVTTIRDRLLGKSHLAFFLRSKVIPKSRKVALIAEQVGLAHYAGLSIQDFSIDREWPIIKKSILENRKTCREHGAKYSLVLLPAPPGPRGESKVRLVGDEEQFERMKSFAQSSSIALFDLKSAYLKNADHTKDIYFERVGHLTDYGHELTAEVLTPFLERQVFDGSSGP